SSCSSSTSTSCEVRNVWLPEPMPDRVPYTAAIDDNSPSLQGNMLGDDADRLALQKASAFVEARWLDAPRLRVLIAGTTNDFGDVPEPGAALDDVVEFCAGEPLSLVLALVREAYVHGGWAVTAATLVADVSWDLVDAVSRVASARFVERALGEL